MSHENAQKEIFELLSKATQENNQDQIDRIMGSHDIKIYAEDYPVNYLTMLGKLLPVAVENNNFSLSKFWIAKCEKTNPKRTYREIALHTAIKFGHEVLIDSFFELLEKENFNFPKNRRKKTALMTAAEYNHLNLVEKFLGLGQDIAKTDIDGETVFHYATRQKDSRILKYLLKQKNSDTLLNKKNIYGYTPLDIALQNNHKENILLLSPNYDFDKISQEPDRKPPTIIAQRIFRKQSKKYLEIQNRSLEFFDKEGDCHGKIFKFEYYASRGMIPYFYSTLELMALWNHTKISLEEAFHDDLPQKKYYKNLSELFEQWINDIIFFLHSPIVRRFTGFGLFDRRHQYSMMSVDKDEYMIFYDDQKISSLKEITEKQLAEFLQYLIRMPVGINFEVGGSGHTTGGYIQATETVAYYDANLLYELTPLEEYKALLDVIIDYKYIYLEQYGEKLDVHFTIACFKKYFSFINLEKFEVFKPEEMPDSKEAAENFQKNSPNQFTHLHIAAIMHSHACLRKLLMEGYCDVNAVDVHGRTIFDIALTNNDLVTINLLTKFCVNILDTKNMDKLLSYYTENQNSLYEIISIFSEKWLDEKMVNKLLEKVIYNTDLSLIKFLVEEKKVNPDQFYNEGNLLLNEAIIMDKESIVNFLLDNKVSVLKLDINKRSAVELSIRSYSGKYYQKLIESHPKPEIINEAIKIAAMDGSLDIFKDLINRGADVNARCASSGEHLLLKLLKQPQLSVEYPEINETREERIKLIFPKIIFNLDSPKDRETLYIMLFMEINNSTFSKDFSEAFFKQILSKCQNNKAILDQSNVAETQVQYGLLCKCIDAGKVSKFKLLLEAGCNPNVTTSKGHPLLVANLLLLQKPSYNNDQRENFYQMIELLLQHHADTSLSNREEQSGIMLLNKYKVEDPRLNEIYINANIQEDSPKMRSPGYQ